MTIETYVTCEDFKKIIDDKVINASAIKQILQKKGILPVYTYTEDLAELSYRIFYGSAFMISLGEMLNLEQNNLKSTVAIIKPKSNNKMDFIQEINNEFQNARKIPQTLYTINNITKSKDNSSINIEYSYKKTFKGKISLLEKRDVNLNVTITPVDDKYKVNIVHEGVSDSKHFINFLDDMMNNPQSKSSFNLSRILLRNLTVDRKVQFFDKFGGYKFTDWILRDITSVSLNKDQNDEEELFDSQDQSEPLHGISSAILHGGDLRKVEFVNECMKKGFFFQSMRYKLEHKSEPKLIEIDISFKQNDLKVIIYKTYETDENGKYQTHMFSHNKQNEYIDYFQNIAYEIYANLIQSQKQDAIS